MCTWSEGIRKAWARLVRFGNLDDKAGASIGRSQALAIDGESCSIGCCIIETLQQLPEVWLYIV